MPRRPASARTVECVEPECHEPAITRGWCNKHIQRVYAHGDPTVKLAGDVRYPVLKSVQVTEEMSSEIKQLATKFEVPEAEIMRRAWNLGLSRVGGTFT
jgi:hypothetical protein